MKPARLASVPAAAALLLAGAGCGGSGGVSLRSAEAAFDRAQIPFQSDWRSGTTNPFLTQAGETSRLAMVPVQLRPRLRAAAWALNANTFQARFLLVFARSSDAQQFLAWDRKGVRQGTIDQGKNVVLVARNAVYFGQNLPAARRAMATLRG